MKELLEFELGLAKACSLDAIPAFDYKGNDPLVDKAYKLICLMRQFAKTVTIFETNIIPYWLAMLEWTFSVVCYIGVNPLIKKYAVYSAAVICEKIDELEK